MRILGLGEKEDVIGKEEMGHARAVVENMDGVPSSLLDSIVDGDKEFFHAEDEEVR
ncbi:hypothetical protein A2U01_0079728 [Trifolium medium]|uniref:Uncharacterized protein n=1 Tax=Trifolium medium TaxID=97028 RepID=A0A392TBE8_9FABA|nr:hypothetical protein [Trifolium medium]